MSSLIHPAVKRRRPATLVAIWGGSALVHAGVIAVAVLGVRADQETPAVTPPMAIQIALASRSPATPTPKPRPVPPAPAKPVTHRNPQPARTEAPRPALSPSPTPAPAAAAVHEAAPAESAPAALPAPAAPPAPVAPEPVTPPIGNAAYLHNPAPRYPAEAQDNGWVGRTVLRVHVDAAGHPLSVELRTSSGHAVLDKAALDAVRQWSFVPAKRGATPVEGWVDVPLDFHLD